MLTMSQAFLAAFRPGSRRITSEAVEMKRDKDFQSNVAKGLKTAAGFAREGE
jgi:hypothetical protein